MSERSDAAMYFNEVTSIAPDIAYFSGHLFSFQDSGNDFTRVMKVQGYNWGCIGDIEEIVWSICAFENGDGNRTLVLLGRDGLVTIIDASGIMEEVVDVGSGNLFEIKKIGQTIYLCGSLQQVFRRTQSGWVHHDQGIVQQRTADRSPAFFGMDGTAEDDIYCVGRNGVIAYFDGVKWSLFDSPTDVHLERVFCVGINEVYLCGRDGVFLKGSRDTWHILGDSDYREHFWGLAKFRNKVYVCSDKDLFSYDGKQLKKIKVDLGGEINFYRLSATENYLWATSGREDVYRFDGKTWERLICPDNRP